MKRLPTATSGPAEGPGIEQHRADLFRWLRYLGAPDDVAEDLTQDTMIRALDHDLAPDSAAGWLRTTARHLWVDRIRQDQRRAHDTFAEEVDAEVAERVFVERSSRREEEAQALKLCLGTLSTSQRDLLERRYSRDEGRRELGARFGLGDAGVKQRLRRLRQQLKDCIDRRIAR